MPFLPISFKPSLRPYIVAICAIIATQANAYFLDGEMYAGLSAGLLLLGSISDIGVQANNVLYIGPGTVVPSASFHSASSPDMSGINFMFNGYVGIIDDLNIAYELSLNWIGSNFSGNDDKNKIAFDSVGVFLDVGYDVYSLDCYSYMLTFFGKGGLGIVTMYNIGYSYVIQGNFGGTQVFGSEGSVNGASSLGLGLRGAVGARTPIADYASMSLSFAVLYLSSIGKISASGSQFDTADVIFAGDTRLQNDGINIISGVLTFSAEMLVW